MKPEQVGKGKETAASAQRGKTAQAPTKAQATQLPSRPRVLFILKYRTVYDYGEPCHEKDQQGLSSGLLNSAQFVSDMLNVSGVESKLVQVVDANCIDKEVYAYKPTHVFLEALWVPPAKFYELLPLHPKVKWIVRLHSNLPFLACEGIAMDWIKAYAQIPKVTVAVNSLEAQREVSSLLADTLQVPCVVPYLPNYYPTSQSLGRRPQSTPKELHVGCFGAIRPLKNQLIQAVAAMQFAHSHGKKLFFHVNGFRREQGGDNVMKNLRMLFDHSPYTLVEHAWMNHASFLELLKKMDVGMQVSFSETFNIVSADMVSMGVPIVVSSEITWASKWSKALCTDVNDIVDTMEKVTSNFGRYFITLMNQSGLVNYSQTSKSIWLQYVNMV